jgi:hypothetical protein
MNNQILIIIVIIIVLFIIQNTSSVIQKPTPIQHPELEIILKNNISKPIPLENIISKPVPVENIPFTFNSDPVRYNNLIRVLDYLYDSDLEKQSNNIDKLTLSELTLIKKELGSIKQILPFKYENLFKRIRTLKIMES